VLSLDESPVKKAGTKTAGAARQWNGRIGHVDLSQVGTFLAYANGPVWTWVDGELFLPERWLGPELAEERERLGIPAARTFQTKVQLGWEMIQRAQAEGLPFEAVACDELYGRSGWLRARLDEAKLAYLASARPALAADPSAADHQRRRAGRGPRAGRRGRCPLAAGPRPARRARGVGR
jgi:SRSO17 transposase